MRHTKQLSTSLRAIQKVTWLPLTSDRPENKLCAYIKIDSTLEVGSVFHTEIKVENQFSILYKK